MNITCLQMRHSIENNYIGLHSIHFARDRSQRRLCEHGNELYVSTQAGNIWTSCANISFNYVPTLTQRYGGQIKYQKVRSNPEIVCRAFNSVSYMLKSAQPFEGHREDEMQLKAFEERSPTIFLC
jgi:hypothetical protein